jgi:hypothetical protein
LKGHAQFDEAWVKDRVIEDASILGLGNLKVRDIERIQKRGRLDLLLADDEDEDDVKWYEVELQLGETDASHIIRTIEYWDEEQRRYPNRTHCAVLIAEDVTNRFLNVLSLFNRHIPIVVIQMKAIQVQDSVLLHFTRVLDTVERPEEEDEGEDKVAIAATREDLQSRSSEVAMGMVDSCLEMLMQIDTKISLTYRKGFASLALDGRPSNFVTFYPKKQSFLSVKARPKSRDEWTEKLKAAGLEVLTGGQEASDFAYTKGNRRRTKIYCLNSFVMPTTSTPHNKGGWDRAGGPGF